MPKLGADKAEEVNQAENTGGLIEPGVYEVYLKECVEKQGQKGPFWSWTFAFADDAPAYGKRHLWMNTSLSAESAWKLKETFDAFRVPTDTDTDTLVGRRVLAKVGVETAQAGKMQGQLVNRLEQVLPVDPVATVTSASGKVTTDDAPLF